MFNIFILSSRLSRFVFLFIIVSIFLVLPHINNLHYIFPTITSKFLFFSYVCIVLLALYILKLLFNTPKTFILTKVDMALLLLIIYITFNRYIIQPEFGFSIRYMELLGLCLFYIIIRIIKLKDCFWLFLAVVVSGIIQAVYGSLQSFGYYPSNHSGFKMSGSFFNPGPYAGFLISVWAIALGMYLFKDNITTLVKIEFKIKYKFLNEFIEYIFDYIPLMGLVSIAIVLPALQSRASWLAMLVGSGILMELKYHFLKKLLNKIKVILKKIVLILLFIGVLSTLLFSLYHYKKASSDGRVLIWKVTSEIIADLPVFGTGFDRFKANYMNYQADYFAKKGEINEVLVADNTIYAFNEWLQFIAENGFLGFLLLLIITYFLFQTKAESTNIVWSKIAKAGLLSIGIFACFSYPTQILPIKIIFVFLIAILSNCDVHTFEIQIKDKLNKQWLYKTSAFLLACITIYQTFIYTSNLNQGFITWNSALNSYQSGDYKKAIQEFESAYPIFKKDGDFLMNYGKTFSMAKKHDKAIVILERAKHYQNNIIVATAIGDSYTATFQYDKAEKAYQQAINMVPGKFYANYLLVKLYDVSGKVTKATSLAQKILKKKIKIPSTAIKEIHEEMKKILIKYKNPPGYKN